MNALDDDIKSKTENIRELEIKQDTFKFEKENFEKVYNDLNKKFDRLSEQVNHKKNEINHLINIHNFLRNPERHPDSIVVDDLLPELAWAIRERDLYFNLIAKKYNKDNNIVDIELIEKLENEMINLFIKGQVEDAEKKCFYILLIDPLNKYITSMYTLIFSLLQKKYVILKI